MQYFPRESRVSSMAVSSVVRPTKDYDIQCDDTSELVKVSDFKKRCKELYHDIVGEHVSHEGTHVTYPKEVVEICNTESLMPADGLDQYIKRKKPTLKNTKLQCINQADVQKEYFDKKGLVYHGYGEASSNTTAGGETSSTSVATVDHGEVVLSVFIYHPLKKRQETRMFVLGCQLLTELRDKVTCFRDFIVDRDFSEDPDEFDHKPLMTGAAPNPSVSAFFFINNTFYNDHRHPSGVDLSAPIIEWSKQTDLDKSPRLDHYHKADMATTRLDQLSLRLGYPYLFCHHNTCQHIVIFTDLRLLHPTESQLVSDYPKVLPIHSGKRKLCQVCNLFSPRWVTLEDELAPESPCLFCSDCFKKLHYSAEGRKMCRFKAYPYNPTMLF